MEKTKRVYINEKTTIFVEESKTISEIEEIKLKYLQKINQLNLQPMRYMSFGEASKKKKNKFNRK